MTRYYRLPHGISALALSVFVVSAFLTAQRGYAVTFYSGFSLITWVSFGVLLTTSLATILWSAHVGSSDWKYALILLLAGYALFWELPHLLGLRFWASPVGDLLHHFAYTNYILINNEIFSDTIYPLIHILLGSISMITGISVESAGSLMTYTTFVTFLLTFGVIGRYFHTKARTRAFVTIIGVAAFPIYGKYSHHIFPWFTSFVLILPTLYAYLKTLCGQAVARNRLITLVLAISISLFHPMTALVLFGCLATVGIVNYLLSTKSLWRSVSNSAWLLIIPLLHFAWYFDRGISVFITRIAVELSSSVSAGASMAADAAQSGYTISQLIWRFLILQWGGLLITVGIAGLVGLYYMHMIFMKKHGPTYRFLFPIAMYVAGLGLAVVMLAGSFISSGPYRINQVTFIGTTLLIGGGLIRIQSKDDPSRLYQLLHLCFILVVIIAALLSVGTVYNETVHITDSELEGVEWFTDHRNDDIETHSSLMTHKETVYVQNADTRSLPSSKWAFSTDDPLLPKHLGYTENKTIKMSVGSSYVVTKTRDLKWWRAQPPNRYSYIRYYDRTDLAQLRHDRTAGRIYTNGRFTVWFIP